MRICLTMSHRARLLTYFVSYRKQRYLFPKNPLTPPFFGS